MPISINENVSFKGKFEPGQRIADAVASRMPEFTIKNPKHVKILHNSKDKLSSPEQRLIMGITALCFQPFIDLHNKRVDEDTRLTSFCRIISKIVVGTVVGVLVRRGCINFVKKYSQIRPIEKLGLDKEFAVKAAKNSFLSPSHIRNYSDDTHNGYINTLGTIFGVLVSLVTNFAIDAPLTQIMTNTLYKHAKGGNDATHS